MAYQIQILDNNLNYRATVRNLQAFDNQGTFLQFSKQLSNYATARFRVGTKDPLFVSEGNILNPFQYHVRILRSGVTVWQGIIVKNTHRTKNYIDVEAFTYEYLLTTILVKHDPTVNTGDGKDNYRTFSSGTLATAVSNIITEAQTAATSVSPLSKLTIGTVDNPNFPAGAVKADGTTTLTGPFTFSSTDYMVQFSYKDIFYCISQLAVYGQCDFTVTNDLVFNFKTYIGNKQNGLVFNYGTVGSAIMDYDVPLDGEGMANELIGIAADTNGQIFHTYLSNNTSINTYGKKQGIAAFSDVKNLSALKTRLGDELTLSGDPSSEINITLTRTAFPLGQWDLGDTITIQITDHIISVNQARRIVGYEINVKDNGEELVQIFTNLPKANQ